MLRVAHDGRATAVGQHHRALRNRIDCVVRAFAVHVRFQQQQEALDVGVREQHDVADAAQRSDKLGPIVFGQDRPVGSLQLSNRAVAVDCHDQTLSLRRCALQVSHVSDVEQIENAVRERNGASGGPLLGDRVDKLCFRNHPPHSAIQPFRHCSCRQPPAFCWIASFSSRDVMVAVPRFITTRPPE
jgi:hypothetical protein